MKPIECESCGHRLGYVPEVNKVTAVEPEGDLWQALGASSSLTDWRRQRDPGAFEALTPVRRGPKTAPVDPLEAEFWKRS
jgi:hypothetical protein